MGTPVDLDLGFLGRLTDAQESVERLLKGVLVSEWMMPIAFALIMQWYVLPLFPTGDEGVPPRRRKWRGMLMDAPDKGSSKLYIVGQNLLVFQIFFAEHLKVFILGLPLMASVLTIVYNQYVLDRVRNRLALCAGFELLKDKVIPDVTSEFGNLSGNLTKTLQLGLVQCLLMLLYLKALHDMVATDRDLTVEEVHCAAWVMSVLIILVAGDMTGNDFDRGQWDYIEIGYRWIVRDWDTGGDGSNWRTRRFSLLPGGERLAERGEAPAARQKSVIFTREQQELWAARRSSVRIDPFFEFKFQARRGLDFFINSLARLIVLSTSPVLLALETESDALEFLKDSTAIFFIAQLDDLSPSVPVDDMLDDFVDAFQPEDRLGVPA